MERTDDTLQRLTESIADRYRIDRLLGSGGMADVYLAHDLRHDRDVAIKVLRPEITQALGSKRFHREISLLARLQHPNLLALVDSGEVGGTLYYVMPYLHEGSLRARLERERELPLPDAVRLLREIAQALEHAHASGVVHRDIKPENVLFSAGHAQVADFGIARLVNESDHSSALTTVGMTIGTPRYMAPEQAAGDPTVDHRADLYALGVLAYEVLAGVPPLVAGSAAGLLAMHRSEVPVPLAQRRPSVPAALEEIVMRCLEKRPADRWQSATEMIAALDRIGTAERVAATPTPAGTVTAHLPITGAMARRLDRASFDPRMIGDTIEYLDNRTPSDVLVMLLNAVWFEGSDLEPHLRLLPYRCVAPTPFGFTQDARHRFPLSLRDHSILLGELLQSLVRERRPAQVVIAGFSSAADLVLRLPTFLSEEDALPDAVLALGPNQGIDTCFVSRVLAGLEDNDPAQLLGAVRTITAAVESLDDWMLLNGYLGRILGRFRSDLSPLRRLANDIIEPFEKDDEGAFAAMYREATAKFQIVRCVFEDSPTCNRHLREVLTAHMDNGILGDRHRDGALQIEPTPSHFDLLQPTRIAAHLATMVEELRAAKLSGT